MVKKENRFGGSCVVGEAASQPKQETRAGNGRRGCSLGAVVFVCCFFLGALLYNDALSLRTTLQLQTLYRRYLFSSPFPFPTTPTLAPTPSSLPPFRFRQCLPLCDPLLPPILSPSLPKRAATFSRPSLPPLPTRLLPSCRRGFRLPAEWQA
ncbi:hypothetical protein MLD38_014555 [Melastoma candidum]|uniref:Uncharacterized protein n=1 Tax=Melastoma candidum TaxID=119954 RepID=A0ACB9RF14_9MYRT|nr:hypothetical protein MLD38_014555 [Melastoma candidum]